MIQKIDKITGLPTFLISDFDEPVLYKPARTEFVQPCFSLKIITAFTDCERISTHMIKLAEGMKNNRLIKGISVEIILGMTKSSLSQKKHEDIRAINTCIVKENCYLVAKMVCRDNDTST